MTILFSLFKPGWIEHHSSLEGPLWLTVHPWAYSHPSAPNPQTCLIFMGDFPHWNTSFWKARSRSDLSLDASTQHSARHSVRGQWLMLDQKLKLSESNVNIWVKKHQPTTERSKSKFCFADFRDIFEILKKNNRGSEWKFGDHCHKQCPMHSYTPLRRPAPPAS